MHLALPYHGKAVNKLISAISKRWTMLKVGKAAPCCKRRAICWEKPLPWTQPLRHDETDENVVSISRFRNHVWWVGGNALAYRSLLPVAPPKNRSIPMIACWRKFASAVSV